MKVRSPQNVTRNQWKRWRRSWQAAAAAYGKWARSLRAKRKATKANRRKVEWEREMRMDPFMVVQRATEASFEFAMDRLRAERDAARDALEECVIQACSVNIDESSDRVGLLDSMSIRAYADALRLLAQHGRVRIVSEAGRRVTATVVPREERR